MAEFVQSEIKVVKCGDCLGGCLKEDCLSCFWFPLKNIYNCYNNYINLILFNEAVDEFELETSLDELLKSKMDELLKSKMDELLRSKI